MKHRKNPPKRNENDTRVTFQIPKTLLARLKKLAKNDDRPLSSYMRHMLAKFAEDTNDGKTNDIPEP